MCKWNKYGDTRIDPCMKWVGYINQPKLKVLACCCGHGKYPMTIVVRNHLGSTWDLISNARIPRKRNFYRKDKKGVYCIPEAVDVSKSR